MYIAQMGCRKIHLFLDFIDKEYHKHFDYIIVICPILRKNNETSHARGCIKNDDKV